MKFLLYNLLIMIFFASCKESVYELNIPVSDIGLIAPLEGASINLDDVKIETYTFTWNKEIKDGAVLILSTSEDLKKQVRVEIGTSSTFSLSAFDADIYFSQLGLKPGESALLYWTVKEKNTDKAAKEIRKINVKRTTQKLIYPENLASIYLDVENESTKVLFEWDTTGMNENAKYKLCLSLDPKMNENVWKFELPSSDGKCTLTHLQLQEILEHASIKHYVENQIYWNVQINDEGYLSRMVGAFNIREMMRFVDRRGDEETIYRVTRICYSDGTSQIWLADNLRTSKYPDGQNIENEYYRNGLEDWDEGKKKAYGLYYHCDIRHQVVPAGWHLPTKADFDKLFEEAALVDGKWNVLKDPFYYMSVNGEEHLNEWGLNLCSSGQWASWGITNYDQEYCYFLASDLDNMCILHAGAPTMWTPETVGAPIRLIYNEN